LEKKSNQVPCVNSLMRLHNDEIIIRKSRANHLKPFEGVGGKLYLTNQRLFFKSHFLNIQTHEESILLENIAFVEAKYNDFISSKITIFLKNGSVEKFHIAKRKRWVEEIEKAIQNKRKTLGEEK
jgi:GRAM domain